MQVSSAEILYKRIIDISKRKIRHNIHMPITWPVRMIADNYNREHHDAVLWMNKKRGMEINASNCHATIKAWRLANSVVSGDARNIECDRASIADFDFSALVDYLKWKASN